MYLFLMVMKRIFDVLLAGLGMMLLAPLFFLLAFLVFLVLGRPVFFAQERPGLHGRLFTLYKFRTMRLLKKEESMLATDAQRLTAFGRFLRSTSLDELPSLWCVLRGDLSLVGPRPLLPEYLTRYSKEQARRHLVKPGITGYAQVMGRNALDWEQRFKLDVWYVDHQSFGLDLQILLRTVALVLLRKGIAAKDHVTMKEFMGNQHG